MSADDRRRDGRPAQAPRLTAIGTPVRASARTATPLSLADVESRGGALTRELEVWAQEDQRLRRDIEVYNKAHRGAGRTPEELERLRSAAAALRTRLTGHLATYDSLRAEDHVIREAGRRLHENAPLGSALFGVERELRELGSARQRTAGQQEALLQLQRGRDVLQGMRQFAQEHRLGARAIKASENGVAFVDPKVGARFNEWLERKAEEPKEHWAVNLFMKGAGLIGSATTEQAKSWLGRNRHVLKRLEDEAGPSPKPPAYWAQERGPGNGSGPRRSDYERVARAFGLNPAQGSPSSAPPLPPNTTTGNHRRAQIDALNWANQSRLANNPDLLLRLVKAGEDASFHGPSELPTELARSLRAEEIDYYQRLHARNKYVAGRLRDLGARELSNPASTAMALLFDRSLGGVAGRAGKLTEGLGLRVLERTAPGLLREITGPGAAQELRRGALPALQRFGGRWFIAGSEGAGSLPVFKAGGSVATGKLEKVSDDLQSGVPEGMALGIGGAVGRPITGKLPRALWLRAGATGRGLGTGETLARSLDAGLGLGVVGAAETASRPLFNPAPGEARRLDLDPKRLAGAFGERGMEGVALGMAGALTRLRDDLRPYPTTPEIRKRPHLSPAERRAEEQFAAQNARDWDAAVAAYRSKFGNLIGADDAKRLSKKYDLSPEFRISNDTALYEPARTLSREVLRRMLADRTPSGKKPVVLLLAGGPGSGKTSSLKDEHRESSEIIVDSTFSSYARAKSLIKQVTDSGREVSIVYVHRPLATAVRSAIDRALDTEDGRPVTLVGMAKAHFGAQRTLPRIAEEYGSKILVSIQNNSGQKGKAVPMSLKELKEVSYNSVEEAIRDARRAYIEERERRAEGGRPIPERVDRAFTNDL